MSQSRESLIEDYERLLDIQVPDFDVDPYMHGMTNGMLLFHHMAKNPGTSMPPYKSAPEYWRSRSVRYRRKIWLHIQHALAQWITIMTGLTFDFSRGWTYDVNGIVTPKEL